MLSKLMLALIGLALCVPAAAAAEHPEGPHHPALMIPLPGEFMHPPPPEDEEARKKWFEKAFGALDADGDGFSVEDGDCDDDEVLVADAEYDDDDEADGADEAEPSED